MVAYTFAFDIGFGIGFGIGIGIGIGIGFGFGFGFGSGFGIGIGFGFGFSLAFGEPAFSIRMGIGEQCDDCYLVVLTVQSPTFLTDDATFGKRCTYLQSRYACCRYSFHILEYTCTHVAIALAVPGFTCRS